MSLGALPSAAQSAEPSRARCPFVLVTGGKGGVGKTTITANLGVSLAKAGHRPLLVDLDFGLANLDLMLDVSPERNLEAFFEAGAPLADCVETAPSGVELLPASSGSVALGRPDTQRRRLLMDGLSELAPGYGAILGDSPAGIGPDAIDFASRADRVLVVTTPEPAAVTDAYGVIKALDAYARETGKEIPTPDLFLNFVSGAEEAQRVAAKLTQVCRRFLSRAPRLLGWMPRSRTVLAAALARQPFVATEPRSLAARSLLQLGRRMTELGSVPRAIPPLKASDEDDR